MEMRNPERWDPHVGEIYEQHRGALVRTAQRYLDTPVLAEEAVHEAFIRFNRSVEIAEVTSELAYLRIIVANISRSMLRRKQCADRWRPSDARHQIGPDECCLANAACAEIRAACAKLPQQQRRVIEMRYWQGLSEAEIAARLNISPGSVKTHASRARRALRGLLAELAA